MIGYFDLSFKKNSLYYGKKKTGYSYKEIGQMEETRRGQFQIEFPDGSFSDDFYNLARVRDNIRKLYVVSANNSTEAASQEPAGAFKPYNW